MIRELPIPRAWRGRERLISLILRARLATNGSKRPAVVQTHTRNNAAATSHPISVDSCHGANHAATKPATAPATATNIARRREDTDHSSATCGR